jgi:hypothetical protein
MRPAISIFIIITVVFGCEHKNTKANSKNSCLIDTNKVKSIGTVAIKNITWLDSIDQANGESVIASADNITKAVVSVNDSSISLSANIRKDHRVFGYAKPNAISEKLILLSIFTNDVENNPFGCKLGAYYDTWEIKNLKLKYTTSAGNFIEAKAIDSSNKFTTVYFEKKWFSFE